MVNQFVKKMATRWFSGGLQALRTLSNSASEGKKPGKVSQAVQSVLHFASNSTIVLTASCTVVGTGLYVGYKDWARYRRMVDTFSRGNILEPLRKNHQQSLYFERPSVQRQLERIMKSQVTNQYYFIFGEVGTGKTRLVTETVHHLMETAGKAREGAPIYILASQGYSFADSFAAVVNYNFDEHISFKFFLDYLFRVGELPKKDEKTKLERVLSAIEKAAYMYLQKTGKPAVIVIDGVNWITDFMPGALERLHVKAKLWADTNVAKLIFVSNDEKTEEIFQADHSAWSRGALPIMVGDLNMHEARSFLTQYDPVIQISNKDRKTLPKNVREMPEEYVNKVLDLVGGRFQYLLLCKLAWAEGKPFEETAINLILKERSKFFSVAQAPSQYRVIETLWYAATKRMLLKELVEHTAREDILALAKDNIIKLERDGRRGLMVSFQSKLTEVVVKEMFDYEWNNIKTKNLSQEEALSDANNLH